MTGIRRMMAGFRISPGDPTMRRDTFLKSLAALAAAGALPLSARAGQGAAGREGRRQCQLRQQGRGRRRPGAGAVRERKQGRPECIDGHGRRDARRHYHGQTSRQPEPGHTHRKAHERIQRVRSAREFASQEHGGCGGTAEERPRQREVGRRFSRFHRAHRGRHDRARGGRGSRQDQLRCVPWGR